MKLPAKGIAPIVVTLLFIGAVLLCVNGYYAYKNRPKKIDHAANLDAALHYSCDLNNLSQKISEKPFGPYYTISFSYPSCLKADGGIGAGPGSEDGYYLGRPDYDYNDQYSFYPEVRVIGHLRPEAVEHTTKKTILKTTTFDGYPAQYEKYDFFSPSTKSDTKAILVFRVFKNYNTERNHTYLRDIDSYNDFAVVVTYLENNPLDYLSFLEHFVSTLKINAI